MQKKKKEKKREKEFIVNKECETEHIYFVVM